MPINTLINRIEQDNGGPQKDTDYWLVLWLHPDKYYKMEIIVGDLVTKDGEYTLVKRYVMQDCHDWYMTLRDIEEAEAKWWKVDPSNWEEVLENI